MHLDDLLDSALFGYVYFSSREAKFKVCKLENGSLLVWRTRKMMVVVNLQKSGCAQCANDLLLRMRKSAMSFHKMGKGRKCRW